MSHCGGIQCWSLALGGAGTVPWPGGMLVCACAQAHTCICVHPHLYGTPSLVFENRHPFFTCLVSAHCVPGVVVSAGKQW